MHPDAARTRFGYVAADASRTLSGISREGLTRTRRNMILMAEKRAAGEKPGVKLRDLTPSREVKGGCSGRGLHPEVPPLPIPPPGFVVTRDGDGPGEE